MRRWLAVLGSLVVVAIALAAWLRSPTRSQPALAAPPVLPVLPEQPFSIEAPSGGGLVVMLFVDGLSDEVFRQALDAGELPNVERLLARDHAHVTAFGTFPTSTAPAVPELLTGVWASNQLGGPEMIHAFDRRSGRLLRYEVEERAWDSSRPTLFDLVARQGGTAWSYFEGYFPGASLNVHDEVVYLLDLAEDKTRAQRIGAYDRRMVRDVAGRLQSARRAPDFVFIRLGAVDSAGHFYGVGSTQYADAVRTTDRRIGELLDTLELARVAGEPLADRTHIVLVSDHGMSSTRKHLDLDQILSDAGRKPWPTSDPRAVLATYLDEEAVHEHDAIAVPGGSNVSAIYLRRSGLPWSKQGPVDLDPVVRNLLVHDGIDTVAWLSGPNTLELRTHAASGRVLRTRTPDGGWLLALHADQGDPLGYGPLADGEPRSAEDWKQASADHALPLAPFLWWKPFSGDPSTRPDLLVTSKEGWGFMDSVAGDHGALRPELLRVPLIVSGPGVTSPEGPVWLVDLAPTVAGLLGLDTAGLELDGRDALSTR